MCWQLQSNAVVVAAEWGFCVWIFLYALFCYFTTQQIILWSVFSNLIFPRSAKMINFVFRCRFPNFQNKQNIKLYRTTGTTSNYWCIVCSLVSLGILNKQTKAGPPGTITISWSFEWKSTLYILQFLLIACIGAINITW